MNKRELFGLDAISPQEVARRIESVGVAKARLPLLSMIMLGLLAGGSVLVALFYHVIYRRGAPGDRS